MRNQKAHLLLAMMLGLAANAANAQAKGLDALSEQNPEDKADDGESKGDGEEGAKAEKTFVKSATSKAIAEKLFMGTSFGWVKASKSSGTWKSSGMSDLTIGYKFMALNPQMALAGTYRYAPMAVSGTEDGHSYRGVWEAHYFGSRLTYGVSQKLNAIGNAELGYVMAHMNATDALPPESKAASSGVSVAVGGGCDYMISDKWAMAAGPRLNVGFGSFTTIQVAGALGFLF